MINYKNLNGDSNVAMYEIGTDYIDVQFMTTNKDGTNTYRYSYASAGQTNVEEMKRLATQGSGLNSFIIRNVKNNYERKW